MKLQAGGAANYILPAMCFCECQYPEEVVTEIDIIGYCEFE
jgi:hypothetical protein